MRPLSSFLSWSIVGVARIRLERRTLLPLALGVALAAPALPHKVLLVLVDDVGKDLLASAPTPNLDRLAATGRVYRRFWASPMCSPSRAEIMTGLESHRPGNLMGVNSVSYEIPLSVRLLPRLAPGTSTFRGKLHLAHLANHEGVQEVERRSHEVLKEYGNRNGQQVPVEGPAVSELICYPGFHWPCCSVSASVLAATTNSA